MYKKIGRNIQQDVSVSIVLTGQDEAGEGSLRPWVGVHRKV